MREFPPYFFILSIVVFITHFITLLLVNLLGIREFLYDFYYYYYYYYYYYHSVNILVSEFQFKNHKFASLF